MRKSSLYRKMLALLVVVVMLVGVASYTNVFAENTVISPEWKTEIPDATLMPEYYAVSPEDIELIPHQLISIDGIHYEVNDNELTLTSYTGVLTEITIPTEFNGVRVTAIGEEAFKDNKNITSVTIPYNVKTIGSSAFKNCTALVNVTLPDDIKTIDDYTFENCEALESINLPTNLEIIGYKVFSGCISLKNITIPDKVTEIGNYAFVNCESLESINIPKSVKSIGSSYVYGNAFSGCASLETITVHKDNPVYDSRNNCNAIIYTESNELITGSNRTVIPEGIKTIAHSAFSGCKGLESIVIPKSVERIKDSAFDSCESLTSVSVHKDNPVYDSRGNCNAIIEKSTDILICGSNNTVIPQGVKEIGSQAFYGCANLESIVIPDSVKVINSYAFERCSGLVTLSVPKSVTEIGDSAFSYCEALENLTFNASVKTIPNGLFFSCKSLKYVDIPTGVKEIESMAFCCCDALETINIPEGVESIGSSVFDNDLSLKSLYIPKSLVSISESVFKWSKGLESIAVHEENPVYDSRNNCNALIETASNKIILASNNTLIPDGVKIIGKEAFYGLEYLPEITIPASVRVIEESAFAYSDIVTITFEEGVESIGEYAFECCSSIKEITIPSSVTSISAGAFKNCYSLSNVILSDGVVSIGEKAFYNDGELRRVYIPETVQVIGNNVFDVDWNIQAAALRIYYPADESAWNSIDIGSDNLRLLSAPIKFEKTVDDMLEDILEAQQINAEKKEQLKKGDGGLTVWIIIGAFVVVAGAIVLMVVIVKKKKSAASNSDVAVTTVEHMNSETETAEKMSVSDVKTETPQETYQAESQDFDSIID